MQEKIHLFERSKVCHLVPRPINRTVIRTMWVYRNKADEHGKSIRNKARVIVQGYNQEEGMDYDDTFTPVASIEAIKIPIAFALYIEFKSYKMCVKSAFQNGILKNEMYVKQPPGFENVDYPHHVFKLVKALYGLK